VYLPVAAATVGGVERDKRWRRIKTRRKFDYTSLANLLNEVTN
jgi:hypothetical protein